MTDNYPDDIRQYDNDPRSPFYTGPDETVMKEEMVEMILDDPELMQQAALEFDEATEGELLIILCNSMRDIVNGKDVNEAVAIIRQKWLEAAEKYADTQDYEEIMGYLSI